MIEAFEIGVSLALRDGVSESIAQAQRNVEALEKAVNANGLSVRALRDAGVRAVSLVSVQPPVEKAQGKAKPLVDQADSAETAPAPDDIYRPVRPDRAETPDLREPELIETDRVIKPETIESPRGRMASAPVSPASTQPDERERGNDFPSIVPEEREAPPRMEFLAPANKRRDALPQLQAGPPTAPTGEPVLSVVSEGEQPVLASPAPQPPAAPERQKTVLPAVPQAVTPPGNAPQTLSLAQNNFASMSFGDVERTGVDDWAPVPVERVETAPQGSSTEDDAPLSRADSGTLESPVVVKPAAPKISWQAWPQRYPASPRDQEMDDPEGHADGYSSLTKLRTGVATALPRAESAPQPVAPQARGNEGGPQNGDVYLDGVLVGRWMSRFLKREVERADSGPTGFDAKRGRLLPGVTVGG